MQVEQAQPPEQVLALDPVLVRRLWRPVERPGVIDPGPARAMLTRHQRMVAGLPLAELVSRHTGSVLDPAVPIVYALPVQSPPAPASRPTEGRRGPAASSPIVPARPAQPASGLAQSAHRAPTPAAPGSPVPSSSPAAVPVAHDAVPVAHDATPLLIVQGTVAEPAAPGSPPATSPPEQAGPVVQGSPLPGPRPLDLSLLDLRTLEAGSLDPGSDPGTQRPGTLPVAGSPARLSSPAAVPVSHDATPPLIVQRKLAAPTAPGSTAVVPAEPGGAHRPAPAAGSATPLVLARPAPWPSWERPARTLAHPESVRRESVPPEFGQTSPAVAVPVHRPPSRPQEQLPLVDIAAVRTTRSRPVPADQREPVVGHVPVAGQDAGAPRSADRAAQPRRQATASVDVEHIVEAVHRRFVRRLAIEAERRAVR